MMRPALAAALVVCLCGAATAQSLPPDTVVEYTVINRTSATKDANGNDLPPFTGAWVWVPWQKRPFAAGGTATVLPLDPNLAPLALTIVTVKLLPDGNQCTGEKPLYEMTGATTTRSDILRSAPLRTGSGMPAPIRGLLVYPANPKAKLVPQSDFEATDIPAGFADANVVVGVDLTGNGRPEAVVVEYCVGQDGKPDLTRGRRCEDRIQAVHVRGPDRHWMEHRLYEPC